MEYEDIKRGKPSKKKSRVKNPTNVKKPALFAGLSGKLLGLRVLVKRGWNILLAPTAVINRKNGKKSYNFISFYICLIGLCLFAWWGIRPFLDNWAVWVIFYFALWKAVENIIRKR